MTKLIAEKPVFYAGRTRRKGEVFEAEPFAASLLLRTRQVKVYEDPALEVEVAPRRTKRQYRRRDLQSEA